LIDISSAGGYQRSMGLLSSLVMTSFTALTACAPQMVQPGPRRLRSCRYTQAVGPGLAHKRMRTEACTAPCHRISRVMIGRGCSESAYAEHQVLESTRATSTPGHAEGLREPCGPGQQDILLGDEVDRLGPECERRHRYFGGCCNLDLSAFFQAHLF